MEWLIVGASIPCALVWALVVLRWLEIRRGGRGMS